MLQKILVLLFFNVAFVCSSQDSYNCQDFEKLKSYKVIGFGEASHGSYSDYAARAELIKCLIKNGDSISVLIEMPQAAGIAIEKYFNGEIDSDSLINEVKYYGLQTNSFLDFINQFKGNGHVSFHGIDMQLHQSTLVYLKEEIDRIKPNTTVSLMIDSLNQNFIFDYSDSMYQDYLPVIQRNLEHLKRSLEVEGLLGPEYFLSIQYPLQIVEQHFRMLEYTKPLQNFNYTKYRDSCMARNTISLIAYLKKQSLVLAANYHIMSHNLNSAFTTMGGHLKNEYNTDYFIIASQYLKGSVLAVDNIGGNRTIWQKEFVAKKRTIPYLIEKWINPKNDSLIFVSTSNHKPHKLFQKKRLGYDMGTSSGLNIKHNWFMYFNPGEFDAIYFIPTVIPSINISK